MTSTRIQFLENEATRLIDQGRLRPAERILKEMALANGKCLPAHFHLARVYRRTGQFELALRHARRALILNPHERNALLNLALIHDVMGNNRLAASYYKKELSQNPDSPETHWNIGRLYFKMGRWLWASKHLRRCFDLGYEFEMEETVDKLGVCYNKLRDVNSYIEVFTRYVQMFPNASWAFANLGRALLYAKDYKGAILRLSRAQKLGNKRSVAADLMEAKRMLSKKTRTGTAEVVA